MLNLVQLLDAFNDGCGGIAPLVRLVKNGIIPIIQIGVPIILIVYGSIDLGRAVMANKDDEIKAATGRFTKRAIAAIAVFFVVTIVTIVMGLFASAGTSDPGVDAVSWSNCWKNA